MSAADYAAWGLAALVVTVSFLNPGGLFIALLIAGGILLVRYLPPFAGDVVRERQKGASASKIEQRTRDRFRGGDN